MRYATLGAAWPAPPRVRADDPDDDFDEDDEDDEDGDEESDEDEDEEPWGDEAADGPEWQVHGWA
jgi:hypothetical protein